MQRPPHKPAQVPEEDLFLAIHRLHQVGLAQLIQRGVSSHFAVSKIVEPHSKAFGSRTTTAVLCMCLQAHREHHIQSGTQI